MSAVSATKPNITIAHAVGRNGVNLRTDVIAVQKLLNAAGASLVCDGQCGRATISAIEEYQHKLDSAPGWTN